MKCHYIIFFPDYSEKLRLRLLFLQVSLPGQVLMERSFHQSMLTQWIVRSHPWELLRTTKVPSMTSRFTMAGCTHVQGTTQHGPTA